MEKKTYQDWQDLIGGIDDRLFEEICYRLLNKLGYEHLKPRGGSSDGGRDLQGQKTRIEGDESIKYVEKYWFECKCYSSTIPWTEISDKLYSANQAKVNAFIILSNRGLSPQAQDKVEEFRNMYSLRITELCGFPFLDLLFKHKDLCDIYFPGYEIPSNPPIDSKEKHILKASINIGQIFGIELEINYDKKIELNQDNINKLITDSLRKVNYSELGITDSEKANLYSGIAMTFFQFGYFSDALSFVDNALKINSTSSDIINKALILEKLDLIDESEKLYLNVLKKEPKNAIALNNLGHNYKRKFELIKSLDCFNKAIEIDKKYLTAINNKAQTLKELKRFDEAIVFVNEQINENSSMVLQKTKIDVLIEALDLKEAFRLNEQLLKLYPSDIDLINYKGVIYEHNSQYQHKIKYLKLAYDVFANLRNNNPKFILAISNQIVCLMNSGQFDTAEIMTNEGFSQDDTDPFLLHNKSKLELKKGNYPIALDFINKALKKKSTEQFAITKSDILVKLKKYKDADNLCQKLLKNDPKNSIVMMILSESLRKQHQTAKSKLLSKKAKGCIRRPISLLE